MAGEHLRAQARRVVTGVDDSGKSTIVLDENTSTRVETPAFTLCDVWQADGVPTHVDDDNTLTGQVSLMPPKGGLVYRLTTWPPDSDFDPAADYQGAMSAIGIGDALEDDHGDEDGIAGLHQTDTVDVITMLEGELWVILETTETLLRRGDTIIQRGTKHSWSNRSDKPATMIALSISAFRGGLEPLAAQ